MPSAVYEQMLWRWFHWFTTIVDAVLGVGLIAFYLWAIANGEVNPTTILRLLAGFWFLTGAILLYEGLLYRPRPRDTDIRVVDGATFVNGHRRSDVAGAFVFLAWFVVFAVGAVFASGGVRLAVIVIAVLSAVPIPWQIARSRTPTHLVASPQCLTVTSPSWRASLDWDDITKLTWTLTTGASLGYLVSGRPDAASWRFDRLPWRDAHAGHPQMGYEALAFDLDPYLVGMALFCYWKYPTLRSELSTGTARQRLTDTQYALAMTPPEIIALMPSQYRPRNLRPGHNSVRLTRSPPMLRR